ncbi:cupin domain-containing protein [Francisella orientalis]|uniref:cupin domain-containing protein n=1 Tax=Francisella orientalis TaxID=299583 RepID=UPI00352FF3E4
MDDHEYKLDNNQGIEIPAGAVHQVLNKSKDSVRFLVISCPDSHNDRVNVEENENISIGPRAFDKSKILDELKSR